MPSGNGRALGGAGVVVVSAMPTLGGDLDFRPLAYSLGMSR